MDTLTAAKEFARLREVSTTEATYWYEFADQVADQRTRDLTEKMEAASISLFDLITTCVKLESGGKCSGENCGGCTAGKIKTQLIQIRAKLSGEKI